MASASPAMSSAPTVTPCTSWSPRDRSSATASSPA